MAIRFLRNQNFFLFFIFFICLFSSTVCFSREKESRDSQDSEDLDFSQLQSKSLDAGNPDSYWTNWGNRKQISLLSSDVPWDKLDEHMEKLHKIKSILQEVTGLTEPDFDIPDKLTWADPVDIIKYYGYDSVESVNVTTDDGYILTLWRIKCPRNKTECRPNANRNPVLLQHGLLMSGADWLCLEPENILPFMLADKGYEVFIGNSRGNVYSRAHVDSSTTHDPNNPNSSYWRFGVHEMGKYDLPAVISTIKKMTKVDRINYVGYSMGTTQFFIYLAENSDYKNSIRKMTALAPAVYIQNLQTPLKLLSIALKVKNGILPYAITSLQQLLMSNRDGPLTDQVPMVTHPLTLLVNKLLPWFVPVVGDILSRPTLHILLCDGSPMVKNRRALQRSMGHQPAGGSLRTLNHYIQLHKSGLFKKFQLDVDFHRMSPSLSKSNFTNESFSGSLLYSIKRDVPILVLYGEDDSLVVPEDALATVRAYTENFCSIRKFNHLDFLLGPEKEVKKVYDKVLTWFGSASSSWSSGDCL